MEAHADICVAPVLFLYRRLSLYRVEKGFRVSFSIAEASSLYFQDPRWAQMILTCDMKTLNPSTDCSVNRH